MSKLLSKITRLFENIEPAQLPLIKAEDKGIKRVFWLSDELKGDPGRVETTRALTLNHGKPRLGLKGIYGLYASSEWWNNINKKKMPLKFVSGRIVRVYEAGQDKVGIVNTVDVELDGGERESVGIYVNSQEDVALFKVGSKVEIVYAKDELKRTNRDGSKAYAQLALEMAISHGVDKSA